MTICWCLLRHGIDAAVIAAAVEPVSAPTLSQMLVGSPVSRYRDSATPAMLMDWHEKNAGLQHDDGRNREELERVRVK